MTDPTQVRALTFDCYGTLIDWETGIRAYLARLLAAKCASGIDLERFYRHWYFECELPAIAGPFMTSMKCCGRAFSAPHVTSESSSSHKMEQTSGKT